MTIYPGKIRGLILDMDGVLWRASEPICDLPWIFKTLEQMDLKVTLATNNATLDAKQYLQKLEGFGVTLQAWQIVNSSQATAFYLKRLFPQGGPVYILGESGLIHDLEDQGFYHQDSNVLAVVAGYDRSVNFDQLVLATLCIRSGAAFIGTNPDKTFPTPAGLVPGTGSILAFLEAASDVKPVIVGKPNPEMYRVALERLGTLPEETLVVGDRLVTDIAGAQALGCPSALVLSGVTSPAEAQAWLPEPDLITADLTSLVRLLLAEKVI